MTHLQCSQFAWSRNLGRVTSIHAADSVTFAERMQESPSPDHRQRYTGVVNTVLRYSNVLHLHQRVCHEIGDTMVRTSRFTVTFHGAKAMASRLSKHHTASRRRFSMCGTERLLLKNAREGAALSTSKMECSLASFT